MKYVSEINCGFSKFTWYPGSELGFTVSDTEDSMTDDSQYYSRKLLFDDSVIGIGSVDSETSMAVVTNDSKTVQLHKYIKSVVSTPNASRYDFKNMDYCPLDAASPIKRHLGMEGTAITVDTQGLAFHICGKTNSVALLHNCYVDEVLPMNLYDMFEFIMEKSRVNILRYNVIQLYSSDLSYRTCIELVRNAESERYFVKMVLDILR